MACALALMLARLVCDHEQANELIALQQFDASGRYDGASRRRRGPDPRPWDQRKQRHHADDQLLTWRFFAGLMLFSACALTAAAVTGCDACLADAMDDAERVDGEAFYRVRSKQHGQSHLFARGQTPPYM
jgi:hypothetical protein